MDRPAARFGPGALLFCAGAIASAALPALPSPTVLLTGGVLLATALILLFRRGSLRHRWHWLALPIGVLWFCAHAAWLEARSWPVSRAGETVTMVARIGGLPQQDGRGARIEVRPDSAARAAGLPGRVLLSWYRPAEWFRPGELWRLTVRLEPPHGRVNPGLFDYQRYLVARRIGAIGRIVEAERVAPAGWPSAVDRFRQRFSDWLQAETASLDAAALHRALTVGDRAAIDPDLADRLRRTGTAHLLAISGLHVGMVATLAGLLAGLVVAAFRLDLLGMDRKRAMLVAGLVGALVYTFLAGFSLPTRRALVMLVAGFGALLLRRPIQPGHALLTALVAVLLFDPMAPLQTGFWLSFAAVAVLIWALARRQVSSGWLGGLLRAQVAIAIGLLPLNIGIFLQWAPTALLANLVAIPLVGLWVLPCLLAALALFLLGLPAGATVAASETGLALLLATVGRLSELDLALAEWSRPMLVAPGLTAMALALFGAFWLLAPRGWPLRGLGAVLLLPLLLVPAADGELAAGEFDVLMPDLGGGHAVIVITRTRTLLFDTGPGDGAESSLVPSTIAPLLFQSGRHRIDDIVSSHAHRDHSGGLSAARGLWPDAVLRSSTASNEAAARCSPAQNWSADGVEFRFLHPSVALPDLGRDSSCVLEIRSPAGSVLLTGGIGAAVGRRLVLTDSAAPVDALVVPRGGHRDAIAPEWLDRLAPRWSLISAAAFDRSGLPHSETLMHLHARGSQVLATADCGAIGLRFRRGQAAVVETAVARHRRYWRDPTRCGRPQASR